MTDIERLKECVTCYHDSDTCGVTDATENEDGSCPKFKQSNFYALLWSLYFEEGKE